ncbi:MAG: RNA-binding S4 domain-containing protein [Micrococcales bacterium]|nr:RNA-binding S4 domain-containing protein [Micrococcales bacterium]
MPEASPGQDKVRVDAWLWAVRFFKTRSQASAACQAGHVRVRGERAKPATAVKIGDVVKITFQGRERIAIVRGLLVKRVSAALASDAFEDRSPPPPPKKDREVGLGMVGGFGVGIRDRGTGRPTKADRRRIDRLRGRDSGR